jgi:hypothetical protein
LGDRDGGKTLEGVTGKHVFIEGHCYAIFPALGIYNLVSIAVSIQGVVRRYKNLMT